MHHLPMVNAALMQIHGSIMYYMTSYGQISWLYSDRSSKLCYETPRSWDYWASQRLDHCRLASYPLSCGLVITCKYGTTPLTVSNSVPCPNNANLVAPADGFLPLLFSYTMCATRGVLGVLLNLPLHLS